MISKSLSTSEKYALLHRVAGKLAEFCQAMYPLLVSHSDDFGRQAGDPFTVKHAVVPTSPRKIDEVSKALAALHQVGLILWYEVDGRKCIQIVEFEKHQQGLHKRTGSEFPEPSGNFREIPSEQKGTEGKRTEENRTEGKVATATVALTKVPSSSESPDLRIESIVQLWNEATAGTKLHQCRGLSETRRKHIRARLHDQGAETIRSAIAKVVASEFCCGRNDRGWVLTFDWLMASPDHMLRVIEGRYDNRTALRSTGTDGRGRTGAAEPLKYSEFNDE